MIVMSRYSDVLIRIYSMNADGSGLQPLTAEPSAYQYEPTPW